jgi:hypothetical protein
MLFLVPKGPRFGSFETRLYFPRLVSYARAPFLAPTGITLEPFLDPIYTYMHVKVKRLSHSIP